MRFLGRRPRHGREDGAVLVIVVLMIVGLFGMVTLAVDVGALLVKRRQLVTAADAAVLAAADAALLAAAQSCAHKEDQTAADGMAAGYATFNAGGTVTVDPPTYVPGCSHPAGKVTVVVRDRQGTFFAPVLGFADSMPVTARATAIWGGIGSGSFLPFMLSWGKLLNCGFIPGEGQYPQQVQEGTQCTFWMNNRQEEMGASEWATLNLCTITAQAVDQNCKWGWDVPRDYGSNTSTVQGNCSAAPTNDLVNWIQNGSCLTLAWKGYYTSTEEVEEQGQAFNVLEWWLIE
jgi:Flp pilus assembly protein TadG